MKTILNIAVPLLIALLFVGTIFLLVGLMNNEKCTNHGEITNTQVEHYLFGGCYVKHGDNWIRLKEAE